MARIEVAFPEPPHERSTTRPVLDADSKPVLKEDLLIWHFFGNDDRIETVRIDFADPDHSFFVGRYPRNVCQKGYTPGMTFYGRAPDFNNVRTRCKYSVSAFDGNGNRVSYVDPEIIVEDPGG